VLELKNEKRKTKNEFRNKKTTNEKRTRFSFFVFRFLIPELVFRFSFFVFLSENSFFVFRFSFFHPRTRFSFFVFRIFQNKNERIQNEQKTIFQICLKNFIVQYVSKSSLKILKPSIVSMYINTFTLSSDNCIQNDYSFFLLVFRF